MLRHQTQACDFYYGGYYDSCVEAIDEGLQLNKDPMVSKTLQLLKERAVLAQIGKELRPSSTKLVADDLEGNIASELLVLKQCAIAVSPFLSQSDRKNAFEFVLSIARNFNHPVLHSQVVRQSVALTLSQLSDDGALIDNPADIGDVNLVIQHLYKTSQEGRNTEANAAEIFLLLLCNRADLASSVFSRASGDMDDSVLLPQVEAWTSTGCGTFQELCLTYSDIQTTLGKHQPSATITNSKIVGNLLRHDFQEAQEAITAHLSGADESQKNMNGGIRSLEDAYLKMNMIACHRHTNEHETADALTKQLLESNLDIPYINKLKHLRVAAQQNTTEQI